jgi:hypothetical protein
MRRLIRLHPSEILSGHCLAVGGNPKRKFVKLIKQSWEADIDGTILFQPF